MRPLTPSILKPCRSSRAAVLIVLAVASCTTTSNAPGESRSRSGTITRDVLEGSSFLSAHNAIERLRPSWLRPRGAPTFTDPNPYPVVYVDGVRRGQLDELQFIAAEDVETIRHLSPNDATTLYGTGHAAGAILVTTLR